MRTKFIRLLFVMACLFCGSASFGQFIEYHPSVRSLPPLPSHNIDPYASPYSDNSSYSDNSNKQIYVVKGFYIKNGKFKQTKIKIMTDKSDISDEIYIIGYFDNYKWKSLSIPSTAEEVSNRDPDYITDNFEYKAYVDSKTIYF
jgi:hypothetical protein